MVCVSVRVCRFRRGAAGLSCVACVGLGRGLDRCSWGEESRRSRTDWHPCVLVLALGVTPAELLNVHFSDSCADFRNLEYGCAAGCLRVARMANVKLQVEHEVEP